MDLVKLLQESIAQAQARAEAVRKALAIAESDIRKYQDALQVALREANRQANTVHLAVSDLEPLTLTLEDVRTKTDIIRTAFRRAGKPLSSSEIIEAVKPAISRSMVYNVIGQMKTSGELRPNGQGRWELAQQEVKEQEPTEVSS